MSEKPAKSQDNLIDILKRLCSLYMSDIRLTSAEKLTMFSTAVALFSVIMVLAFIAFIFFAMGIAALLEDYIAPCWTYLIMSGILMLLIVLTVLLKDKLIADPIARFISRLLLNPPKNKDNGTN